MDRPLETGLPSVGPPGPFAEYNRATGPPGDFEAMSLETAAVPSGASFFSNTPSKAFAPEDFTADERLMVRQAEEFSRKEVLPVVERLEKQEEGLMAELIRKAGALGFLGVDASEEVGGLGLGKCLSARILELLSLDGSFAVTAGVTSGIGQAGIALFGTEEQKARYLPSIVSGEKLSAYCLSEPDSGSDALSASARADFKGGKWILNGAKMWVSNAKWAEVFTVFAKIDGEKFSAFLLEREFPGLSVAREEHKLGLKGSSTARVVLENAEVPKDNLLYVPGLGHRVALNALNLGRFKLSSMSLGPARHAIELAAAYALERRQFGSPISEFGLIRKKLAEMAAAYYLAESMIYRTGRMIDQAFGAWGGTIEGNRKAAEEFAIECSACKVFATEAQARIVDEAVQVFGGYGFTEEFPVARHFRDARVSRIYEGTNEINRLFVSSRLRKRAEEGRASLEAAADSFLSELAGKAIKKELLDQVSIAAASELVLLAYAEQSGRLRAERIGGVNRDLYKIGLTWLNAAGAAAFQAITGDSVSLPATGTLPIDEVAAAVLERKGPLGT